MLPEAVEEVCAEAELPSATLEQAVQAAELLLLNGCIGRAERLVKRFLYLPPAGQTGLLRTCRRLVRGEKIRRSCVLPAMIGWGTEPLEASSIMIEPTTGKNRVLLVFSCVGAQFWDTRWSPFKDADGRGQILLRDHNKTMFLAGLEGLGRTYAECVRALRAIVSALGNPGDDLPEIFCIGYSMGGYAALRFGLDLGASAVLSLSGATTLDPRTDGAPDAADQDELLNLLVEAAPEMALDLMPLYASAPSPPKLILSYGAENEIDTWGAERMGHLPSVTLEPVLGSGLHHILPEVYGTPMWDRLMNSFLAFD